jgi:hypothetical protein
MFGESTGPVGSAFLDIISLSEMALQGLILQLFSKLRGIILSFALPVQQFLGCDGKTKALDRLLVIQQAMHRLLLIRRIVFKLPLFLGQYSVLRLLIELPKPNHFDPA